MPVQAALLQHPQPEPLCPDSQPSALDPGHSALFKKKIFFLQGYLFLSSKGPLRVLERTGGRSKPSHNGQLALVYENST